MKKSMLTLLVIAVVIFAGSATFAQDTKVVPPGENTLITEMAADTNDAGEQLHDVYLLENAGLYTILETVNIQNEITIKSENPVDESNPPARIRSGLNEEGGLATGIYFSAFDGLTVKDVFIGGMTPDASSRAWGHWLQVNETASGASFHLDNVTWDYIGWSSIICYAANTSWLWENVKLRNMSRMANCYCPWGISFEQNNVESFVVKNSTLYNVAGFLFKGRWMFFNELEFDHVTIVNEQKWPFHYHWYRDAKITNSIFYNAHSYGEDPTTLNGSQDPDGYKYGIVNVDTLPPDTGAYAGHVIPENERKVEVKNNLFYNSSEVVDYWNSIDTVQNSVWMNERTEAMFADDENYPGLVEENTYNEDPGFVNAVGVDQMIDWNVTFRETGEGFFWGHEADDNSGLLDWPLPEDLSYSADLTGTDGKPIGDLNWYGMTAIEAPEAAKAEDFALEQNYPNPFNPTTNIAFNLRNAGKVTLKVYNALGQEVATLINNEFRSATTHNVQFNAANLASGVYFYKLQQGNNTKMKKMLLIK